MSYQRERSATLNTPPDWDVAKVWINGLRARSRKTASAYGGAVNGFLQFVGKPLADVSSEDALEYVSHLNKAGHSGASIAQHISAVRSFLRHCQGLGIVAQTPLDALKGPRVATNGVNRYVAQDEVEKLLAAAREVWRRHPPGRLGRISIVLGILMTIVGGLAIGDNTALGLLVVIVSIPLWMAAIRVVFYIGQWMLTEPEKQAIRAE